MISLIVSSESRPNGRGQAFTNNGTAADCVKKHLFTALDSTEIQQFKRNSDISGSGSQGPAYGADGCSGNAVFWWERCTNCHVDARILLTAAVNQPATECRALQLASPCGSRNKTANLPVLLCSIVLRVAELPGGVVARATERPCATTIGAFPLGLS